MSFTLSKFFIAEKRSGSRQMIAMATGQLFAFSLSLAISRVYTPSELGTFVAFSSAFAFTSIALMGRYEQALLYAKNARLTVALVNLCLLLTVTGFVLLTVLGIFLKDLSFSNTSGTLFFVFVGASSALCILQRAFNLLLVRIRDSSALLKTNFLRPVVVPASQVAFGILLGGVSGLIFGHIVAYLFFSIFTLALNSHARRYFRISSIANVIAAAKNFVHFPIFNLPQNLVFVATEAGVPLIVSMIYGHSAAGMLWFAMKIAMAPVQVLVESVRPIVYRQIATTASRDLPLSKIVLKTGVSLGIPVSIACFFFLTFGNSLISYLLGPRWEDVGEIGGALLILAITHAISLPFIAALATLQKQSIHLKFELISTGLRFSSLLIFSSLNVFWAIVFSSITSSLVYLTMMLSVYRTLRKDEYL